MHNEADLLLVDDNGSDLKLTLHAIRRQSPATRVAVARDGEDALEFIFARGRYAAQTRPLSIRLILLDLKLPKINGFEVLKAIRSDEALKSIPVVILTSSNQERDLVESYALGANSYVQKPVDFDVFSNVVQQIRDYWLSVNQTPGMDLPTRQPMDLK